MGIVAGNFGLPFPYVRHGDVLGIVSFSLSFRKKLHLLTTNPLSLQTIKIFCHLLRFVHEPARGN